MGGFSLYFHIPFCAKKCPYCDFTTYAVPSAPERPYTAALLSEMDYWAAQPNWRGEPKKSVRTIFFGGGTPSLFSPTAISELIEAAKSLFGIEPESEITMEVNPETVTEASLAGYRQAGVNRLSIGVQSFQRKILALLGRNHSPKSAEIAVNRAKAAGFDNISIDLMFGTPQQSMADVESDLRRALALPITHLSIYGLTIEKGTPFFQSFERGLLTLPDEEIILRMMDRIEARLEAAGLFRYEISNFARPGAESIHNSTYWSGGDYLGLGAGAHSFLRISEHPKRWSNLAVVADYIKSTSSAGAAIAWQETLTLKELCTEFFMLGLRRNRGVKFEDFQALSGRSCEQVFPGLLQKLTQSGLISTTAESIVLTDRGRRLADSVFEYFLSPRI